MDVAINLVAMVLLLLLQGFFSGSEIALVNADKLKLRHRAKQGHAGSRLVLKQFERPERLLATTLVGTNVSTVTLVTLAAIMMIRYFGDGGDVIAFLLITPLMLVFGEVVPKSVYQQKADFLAPIIIYPLRVFSWLFFPLIVVFSWFARIAVRLVSGRHAVRNVFVAREKISTLLESVEQAPSADIFDRQRIKHAIRFSDVTAGEVMIPLSDAVVINKESGLMHAVEVVRRSGYNRLPLYDADASRIIGIVVLTTWDLLDPDLAQRSLEDFLHSAYFVAPSQRVEQLLPVLQSRGDHMAIVVDEFGSAIGLISAEDILEQVVGEIEDVDFRLHNHYRYTFEELEKDVYLVNAHLPITDLNELLNLQISAGDFHTVGGLLVSRLQRIPVQDDNIVESGFRFTAVECDERMVKKVKVQPETRRT
jgi:CBS domain containing-hemolysin-like protein